MKLFTILVAGQFLSSIGSGLTEFGLAIYCLKTTGSVTATSIVSICAFLPAILFAPIGGVLADRYDRRKMMMLGELFSGLGLLLCLVAVMSAKPSLVMICVGVGISSVFTALTEPAFKATVSDLLTEAEYAKAGGMVQIANSAKLLISPAIAGLLLLVTSVSTLIGIDILTFFTTGFVILAVKKNMKAAKPKAIRTNLYQEMKQGLQAVRKERGVVALIVIMTLAVFCLGFVQILSKPLVLSFANDTELGILTTFCAFGMMAGSIMISCSKHIKSFTRLLAYGLFGCGVFFALMGLKADLYAIAASGFLMFFCMPAVQIGAEVLIRRNLPNEVQGRAFGMIGLITQMGYIVAYLCSGLLSDYVFEPLMRTNGPLSSSIGHIIGVGQGRGTALLIFITGLLLAVIGVVTAKRKSIQSLEKGIQI